MDLNQILADCDVEELAKAIRTFEIKLRARLPNEVIYTGHGEINTGNKYGAILWHTTQLSAVLHNYGIGDY